MLFQGRLFAPNWTPRKEGVIYGMDCFYHFYHCSCPVHLGPEANGKGGRNENKSGCPFFPRAHRDEKASGKLSTLSELLHEKTANILDRLEKKVRGEEK